MLFEMKVGQQTRARCLFVSSTGLEVTLAITAFGADSIAVFLTPLRLIIRACCVPMYSLIHPGLNLDFHPLGIGTDVLEAEIRVNGCRSRGCAQ